MRHICILLAIVPILALLLTACDHSGAPQTPVASCLVGEGIRINDMGVAEAVGTHREYLIYSDKTFVCIDHILVSDETWETKTGARTEFREWKDLAQHLEGRVLMKEGDVAAMSVEQFIAYMEDTYS